MRFLGRVVLLLAVVGCESAEERGARENAELARKVQEREARDAELRAKRAAVVEAAEASSAAARAAADRAQQAKVDEFRGFTPQGRADALRGACSEGCANSTAEAILAAASGDERQKLNSLERELEATAAEKRRVRFADGLDERLLQKHLNPDGVNATGPGKTTLSVRGWFCSRQFMHDFVEGELGKNAVAAGFKLLRCDGPAQWFTQEL